MLQLLALYGSEEEIFGTLIWHFTVDIVSSWSHFSLSPVKFFLAMIDKYCTTCIDMNGLTVSNFTTVFSIIHSK